MFVGFLHLFATDENVQFNPFHEDTDLADPVSIYVLGTFCVM